MRSRVWLLLGVGILVVAVGAGAFGWSTLEVDEYESDFDEWVSEERPKMYGSVRMPLGAFGYWYPIEKQDLEDQADGCDEVREGRPALDATRDKLPRIRKLPIDWLNPDYRKAVDRDERRARVVDDFTDAADPILRQLERDCDFDGKVLRLDRLRDAQWDKSNKLADPASAPYCEDKDGCIPDDAVRRGKFASALEKSNDHQRAAESLFRSKECASTSFGTACKDVADALDRYLDGEDEYVRQVRALTATSSGFAVNQAADRSERAYKKLVRTLRRILSKQVPGVEDTIDFKDDPTSADAFLVGANNLRAKQLADERKALRGL